MLYDPNATPVNTLPSQLAPTTLAGGAIWIHNCAAGLKAYLAHPTYKSGNGAENSRDVYLYGHFWVQPSDGSLWNYVQNGHADKEQCIENVIQVAHQHNAKVYGVLGVDLGSGGWTQGDVISYTRRAAQNAHILQPILSQLEQYHYDGLINDIEAGDSQNPAAFTTYNANLWKLLHSVNPQFLLGTTLIAKTTDLSTPWQNWRGLTSGSVDFVVIMALDHDSIYPYPTPIVDSGWLQQLYIYLKKSPRLTVEWELPTYCRIWQLNNSWNNQTCEYSEAAKLAQSLQNGTGGSILDDHSRSLDNPYIHYMDTNGVESYLYYETLPSLLNQTKVLQNLAGKQCIYLSFWDDDTGEPQQLWPSLNQQASTKLC